MSSFELNKIMGAVLGAMILAMVCGLIASNVVKPHLLAKPAYMVAAAEPSKGEAAGGAKAGAGPEPIEPLLANANADAGKAKAKICATCHTFDKGGPNRIGPNLYDTFGEPIAEGHNGYNFSTALQAHKGQKWTPDDLNKWLFNPQSFAAGTRMTFPGMRNAQDRADVISYLDSLSDQPKPLGK